MFSTSSFYAVMLVFASASSMVATGVALSRRRSYGAKELIGLLAGLAVWSLTYACYWISDDPYWKYFWLNMTYLGVVSVPAFLVIFACRCTGRDAWITRPRLALFLIEPVLVLALIWSDPWNHWFFAGKRALTDSVLLDGSPLFWFHVVYSYSLMLVATTLLFTNALRSMKFYQWQITVLLASLLLPWVTNILIVTKLSPFPDLDLTPIVFTFTGVAILYDMLKRHLLDILPIARDLLVDSMNDGLLVLDNHNRVADFNAAARDIFSDLHPLTVGQLIMPLLIRWPDLAEKYVSVEQLDTELFLDGDPPIYFDLHIRPIKDKWGRFLGRLFIWRNVTSHKQVELALQDANQRLQIQIKEVELLQAQVREQSIRDGLTEVFNRRYLDETMEREFERAERERSCFAIVIMDLDLFKSINDTYGHRAGDLALQRVAEFLSINTRASDIVCRYGGEEFVVVMPGVDIQVAYSRAEHWRQSIEALDIVSPKGAFHVTASIGVAIYPDHAANTDDLLRTADDGLYEAKRQGKNRVVISGG